MYDAFNACDVFDTIGIVLSCYSFSVTFFTPHLTGFVFFPHV